MPNIKVADIDQADLTAFVKNCLPPPPPNAPEWLNLTGQGDGTYKLPGAVVPGGLLIMVDGIVIQPSTCLQPDNVTLKFSPALVAGQVPTAYGALA